MTSNTIAKKRRRGHRDAVKQKRRSHNETKAAAKSESKKLLNSLLKEAGLKKR